MSNCMASSQADIYQTQQSPLETRQKLRKFNFLINTRTVREDLFVRLSILQIKRSLSSFIDATQKLTGPGASLTGPRRNDRPGAGPDWYDSMPAWKTYLLDSQWLALAVVQAKECAKISSQDAESLKASNQELPSTWKTYMLDSQWLALAAMATGATLPC